ncbi:nucleotidyltransferase family protein [Arenibaculum pallidiluteum]|uniref:hypothetical protein n=1 Tax=Arenibaculum pallidiluteum TaxID=2812559 RepID=UPI001A97437C|nr:hypothetical protein [Arenibaculum pallidiluteum]
MDTAEPTLASLQPEAIAFYAESLRRLQASGLPFLVSGTYAINAYTGLRRPTKDIDVFCKAGDFPRILQLFPKPEFTITIEDERWLAKVHKGDYFFDVIFNSTAGLGIITDQWFDENFKAEVLGVEVKLVPPTEMVFSKAFVQNRERYDGADVAHMILRQHEHIDWHRLLCYMEAHWEVLLMHILNFRFIYPSEREIIPRWLLDELLDRLKLQEDLPTARIKICRGRLFSPHDYEIDVKQWGFADVVGRGEGVPVVPVDHGPEIARRVDGDRTSGAKD